VKTLLTTLSPQDRAAVVLFYWYEFSYEEIAQALRLTVSAVKSRLHRARMALASSWREQESARQAAVLQAARERTNHGKAQSPAFQ
jgi:RNA polymerase sigma-70 factor (ECF subfamily)